MPPPPAIQIDEILSGDRRALARAITLIESTRRSDRAEAERLLEGILPATGSAIRIGISGAPGAGKSTFIESFGGYLTGLGRTVAVLAVDPSSRRSGGSILGDKTRMERLARDSRAFIRPSPAGTTAGGVARRTREAMLLVEAAGFEVVLVETVGVGQSETAVADMVDVFVLLVSPGGGDDLQGIKRGVMELADLVVVTKADGDLLHAANRAEGDYRGALHLMRPKYTGMAAQVVKVSAIENSGISDVWNSLIAFHARLSDEGHLGRLRAEQSRRWFWTEVQVLLSDSIAADPATAKRASHIESAVAAGQILPHAAARNLVNLFRGLDGDEGSP
jgi:LAO/AO transport system kinase